MNTVKQKLEPLKLPKKLAYKRAVQAYEVCREVGK